MAELKIKIGEEYKIKIENSNEFRNSIFNEMYEKAAININDIISQALKKRNPDDKYNTDFSIADDYNNIIAFSGERGTGKSSSMVSFAEALINKDNKTVSKYFETYDNISKKDFLSIQMIDPSLFGENDTLLEIIISKMFLKFQKDLDKKNNSDLDYDKKRKLITLFQKVFENLKTLHGNKKQIYDYEAIETLSKLANGTNLKENIFKLIEQYLDYFNTKEGFLIIGIDDFDLNVKGAYHMLEDIRQYLIQSNIIILLACKIEQLEDSIRQSIVLNYKELIDFLKDKRNELSDTPENMTLKYLDKLLPLSHRLETPKSLFSISKLNKDYTSFVIYDSNDKELIRANDIQEGLLKFIYENNLFFISKSNNSSLHILPTTLRELINLIGYLNANNKIDDLKNYFFLRRNQILNKEYSSFFQELEEVEDSWLNQYILNWLIAHYHTFKEKSLFTSTFLSILNVRNNKNSSFGDLYHVLNYLERNVTIIESNNIMFIKYLKLYYASRTRIICNESNISIYEYLTPSLLGRAPKLFPDQRNNGNVKQRGIFEIFDIKEIIKKVENNLISIESYYWISFFITHLGKVDNNVRNDDEVFYHKGINKQGPAFEVGTFNWLTFLISSLNPDIITERFIPKHLQDKKNSLYDSIMNWNKSIDKNYYDLFNLMFFDEFIEIWSDINKNYRDKLGDYSETMSVYFSETTFENIFSELKKNYPYLKTNSSIITNHPIMIYWKENKKEINEIINEIFEYKSSYEIIEKQQQKTNNTTKRTTYLSPTQKDILKKYIKNYPKNKDKSRTTANLITRLNNFKFQKDLISSIEGIKILFNDNVTNNNRISNDIVNLLKVYLKTNG